MSQTYKGLTIPAYSDIADGPAAFSGFVDSGPIPRFADATARNAAITAPVAGLMIYNIALGKFEVYDGATWVTPFLQAADVNALVDHRVEFSEIGSLVVKSGTFRWYAPHNLTILDVTASVSVAPTGSSLIADVHKNGTSIFASGGDKPTIAAAGFFDVSATPSSPTMTKDTDYLTIDIDQVGSTVAGSNLLVQVRYRRT